MVIQRRKPVPMPLLHRGCFALFLGFSLLAGNRPPQHPVDLNAATATELMQLPRIGARTAARILEYRQRQGPFQRPEELMNVKGIGEKAFKRLAPYLATGPAAAKAGEP